MFEHAFWKSMGRVPTAPLTSTSHPAPVRGRRLLLAVYGVEHENWGGGIWSLVHPDEAILPRCSPAGFFRVIYRDFARRHLLAVVPYGTGNAILRKCAARRRPFSCVLYFSYCRYMLSLPVARSVCKQAAG